MERLSLGWSNSYAADPDYLVRIASLVRGVRSPVLECGSGLSTLVAAAYSPQPVHALEHLHEWLTLVHSYVETLDLRANVILAPLVDRGDYSWYRVPPDMPERFSLVICDGPPRGTKGGRYGLMPELSDRLRGSTILLDDAHRSSELATLRRWQEDYRVRIEHGGSYAIIRVPP
jgi:hypothetical protein